MDNSRLQSQDDARYTLVFPTLPYLKGGSQVEELVRWSIIRSSLHNGNQSAQWKRGGTQGCKRELRVSMSFG